MLVRSVAFVLTLVLACLSAQPASAQDEVPVDPSALYRQAARAYGEGRFAEAADAFEQAYALQPEPSLLYNLGLARERAGDTGRAIDAYERFLEASPDAAERTEVERSLESLRRERDLQLELERRAASHVAAPPSEAPPPPSRTGGVIMWALAGVGVAGVIVGSVLGALAQSTYDDARAATSHQSAFDLERRANDLALAANSSWIAGGGLALTCVILGVVDLATHGTEGFAALRIGPTSARLTIAF